MVRIKTSLCFILLAVTFNYKFWSRDTAYHQVFHRSVSDKLEVVGEFAFGNGFWYSEAIYKGEQRPLASGKYIII